jgi:hypothetical protein
VADVILTTFMLVAIGAASAALLVVARRMRSYALSSVHITSRFPVFKARDEARWLAIAGSISENEVYWQKLHTALNEILHIENREDLAAFIKQMLNERVREVRDPSLAERRKLFEKRLMEALEQNRKLADLYVFAERAFDSMLRTRTTWMSLRGLRIRLRLIRVLAEALLVCWKFGARIHKTCSVQSVGLREVVCSPKSTLMVRVSR